MEKYLTAISDYESEFNCNCGDKANLTFDRSVSNGEIWNCSCGLEIITSHKPNEDNF